MAVVGAILVDVFFRGSIGIRNLVLFSFCFSLSAPWYWFSFPGPENLIVAAALLLLVMVQVRGGWIRYVAALILIGLLPLLKLKAGLFGLTALMGFLAERMISRRETVWREALIASLVVPTVACGGLFLLVPSPSALMRFARGSAEVIGGYSSAMAVSGDRSEILLALEVLAVMLVVLHIQASTNRPLARFYALLLAGPIFFSVKHGFVRQDEHVINFFCFMALALGLVSLTMRVERLRGSMVSALLVFAVIWQQPLAMHYGRSALSPSSGSAAIRMLRGVFPLGALQRNLDSAVATFPNSSRLEPEVIALIGTSSVAALSNDLTNMFAAGMRPALYPTLQRSAAYTAFLDRWNAAWIRDSGPRFLVFDGESIDERDVWAETPAMWLDVYRWYDTRLLGSRTLLLERRATPRFGALETIGRSRVNLPADLTMPVSTGPVFWTMNCRYSLSGSLRKLLFRSPAVTMIVYRPGSAARRARVIPDVLVSPVLGNYLPANLGEFAALFDPGVTPGTSVDHIRFAHNGGQSFASPCEAQLLQLVH